MQYYLEKQDLGASEHSESSVGGGGGWSRATPGQNSKFKIRCVSKIGGGRLLHFRNHEIQNPTRPPRPCVWGRAEAEF
jgi:hypothetical protein